MTETLAPKSRITNPKLCWLSLDSYDNDPNRFWQYLVAALRTIVPHLGATTQRLLSSTPLPPPPALLTSLLNELAALAEQIIVVLDDYHLIADASIHEGLNFLLDHAPSQLHLILITRADPPLALTRLRARGLLNEIRVADLRFTVEETAVFLRQGMGLHLSDKDVAALEARTEGWITGLQLTAVSLQDRTDASEFIRDFSASHYYILEYLTEEVLHQQPEAVQTFLLKTSLLSRLSGPLCNAVTGRDDSQDILSHLHRQNLFVMPLDEAHHWFRYHHLLADLLTNRLRQTASPDEVQALHYRAGRWCEAQGMWETAVSHAIASDDWEWAADMVAKAYQPLIAEGHVATWQRWLAQIPLQLVQSRPGLLVRQGWAAFLRGELQQAEMMLAAARTALMEDDLSSEQRVLRGELATYLATIAYFRDAPDEIILAAEEALTFLPPKAWDLRARATGSLGLGVSLSGDTRRAMTLFNEAVTIARSSGNPFLLAHTLEVVADSQYHLGQLRAAAATCRDLITLGTQDRAAPLPFVGNGYVRLAAVYLEWRKLAQAAEEMAAGLALIREGGIGYNALLDHCMQVRLQQALGNDEEALAILHQAELIFHQNPSHIAAVQLTACAVQFWLNAGNVATAASWIDDQPLTGTLSQLTNLPIIVREVQQISLARVRLAQRRPDAVLVIYDQLHDRALSAGRLARVIEIGLVAALAYEMKGETAVALDVLSQTLTLTRPEGYVQIFVESGAPMLQLLRQLTGSNQTDYTQALLRAFPDDMQSVSSALVEPLSPRELEVLQLIAAGLTNKQITAELIISLNTVKKHTTHIYSKLGVNSRTQAIARARELHLV